MSTKNEIKNEELEQYGRRLCRRIDSVPVEKGETSETMCDEDNLDIPDVVIDGANYVANEYVDNSKNVKCKSIIVHFTTFRHQTRFYVQRKNLQKVSRLNLT